MDEVCAQSEMSMRSQTASSAFPLHRFVVVVVDVYVEVVVVVGVVADVDVYVVDVMVADVVVDVAVVVVVVAVVLCVAPSINALHRSYQPLRKLSLWWYRLLCVLKIPIVWRAYYITQ